MKQLVESRFEKAAIFHCHRQSTAHIPDSSFSSSGLHRLLPVLIDINRNKAVYSCKMPSSHISSSSLVVSFYRHRQHDTWENNCSSALIGKCLIIPELPGLSHQFYLSPYLLYYVFTTSIENARTTCLLFSVGHQFPRLVITCQSCGIRPPMPSGTHIFARPPGIILP